MADAVTSQTIQDGQKIAVLKFTNVSDGTGESAVKKVDVSALQSNNSGDACTSVSVARIYWATRGMGVNLEFDGVPGFVGHYIDGNEWMYCDQPSITVLVEVA